MVLSTADSKWWIDQPHLSTHIVHLGIVHLGIVLGKVSLISHGVLVIKQVAVQRLDDDDSLHFSDDTLLRLLSFFS